MRAQDLRIGNLVNYGINIVPIKSIHIESVLKDSAVVYIELNKKLSHYCVNIEDISPIPLTEDWLLKFGFESNPYQDRYENGKIHIECDKTKEITQLWIDGMPHIQFIHQLQNLYFALTGEELKIQNQ